MKLRKWMLMMFILIIGIYGCGGGGEQSSFPPPPVNSGDGGNGGGGGGDVVPFAPIGVNGIAGNGQVTLSWNLIDRATSYNIYVSTASGVTKTSWERQDSASSSPIVITGLINETPYYFIVTAVNSAGESVESAEVSATPISPRWTLPSGGEANIIVVAPDKSVYVGGGLFSSAVSKFSADGRLLWTYDTHGDMQNNLHGVAVRANGEVYVSRNEWNIPSLTHTYKEFVEKLNPTTGAVLWSKELSPCGSNWSPGLTVNEYGVFAAGFECIAGLDFDGNILGYSYMPNLSGPGGNGGINSIMTDGTNVYVSGNTAGDSFAPNAGGQDVFLAKYDQNGNLLWGKQWGGVDFETDPSLCFDEVTGSIFVSNGGLAYNWPDILSSGGDIEINISISQFNQGGNLIARQSLPETERRTVIDCHGGKIYLGMGHAETKIIAMDYNGTRSWTWIGPLSTYADAIGADWIVEKLYSGGAGNINILSTVTGEKLN